MLLACWVFAPAFFVPPCHAAAVSFTDVPTSHPHAVAIADLSGRGVINGFPDGTFRPGQPVIRQQFAKMIVLTLGLAVPADITCPFADVDETPNLNDPLYPARYVAVCALHGITAGKTPTAFDPYSGITRQQLVTMVVRAAALSDPPAVYLPPFVTGQFSLEEHYVNARRAAYAGLLDGLGVGPDYSFTSAASRGECAQVLHNLLFHLEQGSPADLLHFSWDWNANWRVWQTRNISQLVGGKKVVGDPYYYFDTPDFPARYIFATGEEGDLLVFGAAPGGWAWQVRSLVAPSGRRIRPLLGGRAFNDVVIGTEKAGRETIHIFATDADDNLIHYWLTQREDWHSEDVTAATGQKMARFGSACAWEDESTVQVVGTDIGGDLLHFWLETGGSWRSENVSSQVGEAIVGEASFYWDSASRPETAVVAAGPERELLLFHHRESGAWSVEDVTAATSTDSGPGVTLGGWLSWWWWDSSGYWDGSQFKNPIALLDANGHFQLLERTSLASPWSVTDVSALIGHTFRADTGGDSILRFHNPPSVPKKEINFAGADPDQDFIHFWRDTAGNWHHDNVSAKTQQKIAYPVNHYLWWGGYQGGPLTAYDYVCGIAPDGDLVFVYDDVAKRDWQAFNVSTVTGYKVRPPELPWGGFFRRKPLSARGARIAPVVQATRPFGGRAVQRRGGAAVRRRGRSRRGAQRPFSSRRHPIQAPQTGTSRFFHR